MCQKKFGEPDRQMYRFDVPLDVPFYGRVSALGSSVEKPDTGVRPVPERSHVNLLIGLTFGFGEVEQVIHKEGRRPLVVERGDMTFSGVNLP